MLVRFSLGSNSGFIHGEDRRVCLWIISFDCDKEKVECSVEKFFFTVRLGLFTTFTIARFLQASNKDFNG